MIKNNYLVDRVILIHDIDSSDRIGMQDHNSRYLISWDVFNRAIDDAEKKFTKFEQLVYLEEGERNKNFVRLTVDDGGGSSLAIARLLKEKNIKAYFFIPTKFIGNKGYLNKNEIIDIYKMGHVIGSHSHTHPNPFCEISDKSIYEEVSKSKEILESILNQKIETFSVPGGEIRKNTLLTLSDTDLGLKEIYISTPYEGKYKLNLNSTAKIYGRLCIERKMNYKKVSNYIMGKGWSFNFLNYQLRRFRRELIYKYKHLINKR